jgi:hypothetical protein
LKDYKDITAKDLMSVSKDGVSQLFLLAWDASLQHISKEELIKVPLEYWLVKQQRGGMSVLSVSLRKYGIDIPDEILRRIPLDENGWMGAEIGNETFLACAATRGATAYIPSDILCSIPVSEKGWLHGEPTILHQAIISEFADRIPASIWRSVPFDQQGWFRRESIASPKTMLELLIEHNQVGAILSNDVIPYVDRAMMAYTTRFWHECKKQMTIQKRFDEIEKYQQIVNRVQAEFYINTKNETKKKFDLK